HVALTPLASILFPYTTLFRSIPPARFSQQLPNLRPVRLDLFRAAPVHHGEQVVAPAVAAGAAVAVADEGLRAEQRAEAGEVGVVDRKSTRLNSSHVKISYAVF